MKAGAHCFVISNEGRCFSNSGDVFLRSDKQRPRTLDTATIQGLLDSGQLLVAVFTCRQKYRQTGFPDPQQA